MSSINSDKVSDLAWIDEQEPKAQILAVGTISKPRFMAEVRFTLPFKRCLKTLTKQCLYITFMNCNREANNNTKLHIE